MKMGNLRQRRRRLLLNPNTEIQVSKCPTFGNYYLTTGTTILSKPFRLQKEAIAHCVEKTGNKPKINNKTYTAKEAAPLPEALHRQATERKAQQKFGNKRDQRVREVIRRNRTTSKELSTALAELEELQRPHIAI